MFRARVPTVVASMSLLGLIASPSSVCALSSIVEKCWPRYEQMRMMSGAEHWSRPKEE